MSTNDRRLYNGVFPVEVYKRIIDIFASGYQDDMHRIVSQQKGRRNTLLACSLTCRAWLARTRYHLYSTISLYGHDELLRPVAFIRAFPVIGRHIEVLHIFYPPGDHRSNLVFIYLSILLTNPLSISCSTYPWQGIRPVFFPLVSMLASVTDLRVQTLGFMSSHDFTKFIMAFRSLQRLHISDITSRNPRTYVFPPKLRKPLPLLFLEFHTPIVNLDILATFQLTRSTEHLERVKMQVVESSRPRLDIISNFLSSCISLRDLYFNTDVTSYTSDELNTMDFTPLTALQRVEIVLSAPVTGYPLALRMVSTIQSRNIEHLQMTFWFKVSDGDPLLLLNDMAWSELDGLLEKRIFSSLAEFRLDVFPSCDFLPINYFTSRLPELHKRGIILSPHLQRKGKGPDKGKQRAEPAHGTKIVSGDSTVT